MGPKKEPTLEDAIAEAENLMESLRREISEIAPGKNISGRAGSMNVPSFLNEQIESLRVAIRYATMPNSILLIVSDVRGSTLRHLGVTI